VGEAPTAGVAGVTVAADHGHVLSGPGDAHALELPPKRPIHFCRWSGRAPMGPREMSVTPSSQLRGSGTKSASAAACRSA